MTETQEMTFEATFTALNMLIATNNDDAAGFHFAFDNIENPQAKAVMQSLADQRRLFVTELQSSVSHLGGTPQASGTVAGMLYQGWASIRSALVKPDEDTIITESQQAAENTLRLYEQVLRENPDMPYEQRKLVEGQYEKLQDALGRIRALAVTQ